METQVEIGAPVTVIAVEVGMPAPSLCRVWVQGRCDSPAYSIDGPRTLDRPRPGDRMRVGIHLERA